MLFGQLPFVLCPQYLTLLAQLGGIAGILAASTLDVANEESLYEQQLVATDTTLVSVGHRSTILKYHKQDLELTGDSEWQPHLANDYRFGH